MMQMKKIVINKVTYPNGAVTLNYPVDMSSIRGLQYAADKSYAIGYSNDPTLPTATEEEVDQVEFDNMAVPDHISMRQFWQQLYIDGTTEDQANALIEAHLEDPEKGLVLIEMRKSQYVERRRPSLNQLAPIMGYDTAEKVDIFFKKASQR